MIDIKDLKERPDAYQKAAKQKNIDIDIKQVLKLYAEHLEVQQAVEELNRKKKELAEVNAKAKGKDEKLAKEGKKVKEEIDAQAAESTRLAAQLQELLVRVPMIPSADTPVGKSDADNQEVKKWGEPTTFDFEFKDHLTLGKELDILDMERGAEVSGYRGYFVKNEGVMLMMGVMMYALQKLVAKGYAPFLTPTIVKEQALFGTGYFKGTKYNPDVDEVYRLETSEKESKFLAGTAEVALCSYFANRLFDEKELPLRVCGFSPCYRSEIGSYGKDVKGMYRVHEFMKVEQVAICPADEAIAEKLHQEMLGISEELHRDLGLPYRVIQVCTGDMGQGKYKMFDIEAWIPSRGGYGETGSASNLKDFQSRRLNIKYKDAEGKKSFAYMLNDTALPGPRIFISILENYQQADGSVRVPDVLVPFVGKGVIGK